MYQLVIRARTAWFDVPHPVSMIVHLNQLQKDHYVTSSKGEAKKNQLSSKDLKNEKNTAMSLTVDIFGKINAYFLKRKVIFFSLRSEQDIDIHSQL